MGAIARLLACAGQAAYAASVNTQVPNGWRAQTAKTTKVRVSRYLDPSCTTQMAKRMVKHRRSHGSSRTKLVRTPICWPLAGKQMFDDIRMAGRKQSILENQVPFLTTKIWDALKVNASRFESRSSSKATENYKDGKNLTQQLSRGRTIWRVIRKKCAERCMHRRSSRIYEKAPGEDSTARSWRSHCWEGFISPSHYNLVQKFISMRRAMKIPDAHAAVDKEWEKLEKLPAWLVTKVRSKVRGHSGSTKIAKNIPFLYGDGHLPLHKLGVGTEIPTPKKDVLYPGVTLWRTIPALTLHSQSRVRQHHKWRPHK